jgi:hypothetical protein
VGRQPDDRIGIFQAADERGHDLRARPAVAIPDGPSAHQWSGMLNLAEVTRSEPTTPAWSQGRHEDPRGERSPSAHDAPSLVRRDAVRDRRAPCARFLTSGVAADCSRIRPGGQCQRWVPSAKDSISAMFAFPFIRWFEARRCRGAFVEGPPSLLGAVVPPHTRRAAHPRMCCREVAS